MSERMTIGRFARATRLTVKALRHYDEIGLLRPAWIDRRSGYRWYAPEQVRDAVTIATLRALDLPLPSIARILRDPRGLAATLGEERARIEREIATRQRALQMLDRIARGGPIAGYEVQVCDEPARTVAMTRVVTGAETLEADTTRAVRETLAALHAAGVSAGDPLIAIFGASIDEATIPLDLAFTVPDGATFSLGPIVLSTLPGGRCGWVRHVGPYPELALAHHALLAWAEDRPHGAIREIYRNDPDEVAPDALVTDVLLPLEGDPR